MRNRRLRFTGIVHFHKREPTRLPRVTIRNYVDAFNSAILCESGLQLVLCRSITEITHKNVGHSVVPFFFQYDLSLTDCAETNWNRWKKGGREQTRILTDAFKDIPILSKLFPIPDPHFANIIRLNLPFVVSITQ